MKLQISKLELQMAMKSVSGAVSRKPAHEVLSNILFRADENGLTVVGTDNEIELAATVKMHVETTGEITLPAKRMMSLINSLDDQARVSINVNDGECRVSSGGGKYKVATLPAAEFPVVDPLSDAVSVTLPASDLLEAISRTSFAMGYNDVRFYLNGLLLSVSDGSLTTVAADGHRLAVYKVDINDAGETKVIIPNKSIEELSKALASESGDVTLNINKNQMQINFDGLQLTTKLIDAKYPDHERLIPLETSNRFTASSETLKKKLARSLIFANEVYKAARFTAEDNRLTIESENARREESTDGLDIEYAGESVEAGFNAVYLMDAMNAMNADKAEFILVRGAVIIKPADNPCTTYVVMQMRL